MSGYVSITDLKGRLDRATYCFRTQVFEAIGAILVEPNLLLIGGFRGVARIFQRGVTLCQGEGIHQIVTMAKISSWHFRHLL